MLFIHRSHLHTTTCFRDASFWRRLCTKEYEVNETEITLRNRSAQLDHISKNSKRRSIDHRTMCAQHKMESLVLVYRKDPSAVIVRNTRGPDLPGEEREQQSRIMEAGWDPEQDACTRKAPKLYIPEHGSCSKTGSWLKNYKDQQAKVTMHPHGRTVAELLLRQTHWSPELVPSIPEITWRVWSVNHASEFWRYNFLNQRLLSQSIYSELHPQYQSSS